MKKTAQHLRSWVAVIVISCAFPGCEEGTLGPSLGISPAGVALDLKTGFVIFEVISGTTEGSFPLEWRAENPQLGRVVRSGTFTATYARFNPNGQNRVIVRDQHGVEGIAVVSQVDHAPPFGTSQSTPTTPTTTTTIADEQGSAAPGS